MKKLSISLSALLAVVFALTTAFTSAPKVTDDPAEGFTLYLAVGAITEDVPAINASAESFWIAEEEDLNQQLNGSLLSQVDPRTIQYPQEQHTYAEEFCVDDTSEDLCMIVIEFEESSVFAVRDVVFGKL